MASAPQPDILPLQVPFHDQVFNNHQSLSIAHLHKKAVLDRLFEISFMFQQQYSSAGRGIALSVSHRSSTGTRPLDPKKPVTSASGTTGSLIARRVAVQKLATRLPFSPSKALHHARRMQFLGRNSRIRGWGQQRSLNFLRFTVMGWDSSPLTDMTFLRAAAPWVSQESNPGAVDLRAPESTFSESIDEHSQSVGESNFLESLLMSSQNDPSLQDITCCKRRPALDIGALSLDSFLDDMDDFQLPAAEDSDSDSWHLSF